MEIQPKARSTGVGALGRSSPQSLPTPFPLQPGGSPFTSSNLPNSAPLHTWLTLNPAQGQGLNVTSSGKPALSPQLQSISHPSLHLFPCAVIYHFLLSFITKDTLVKSTPAWQLRFPFPVFLFILSTEHFATDYISLLHILLIAFPPPHTRMKAAGGQF